MSVVGTLTVDLVANTATFTADLGKAGNSLDDLGEKAKKAGGAIDYSMAEAKGSTMLLSEELGLHIPRHLQTLINEIPLVGQAFAAMLPLVGVIAAIAIITELIVKSEEAREKLAQSFDKFGQTGATVMNDLDDRLLRVGKRADELAGNHLQALREELLLIDRATLKELIAEFGKLSGVADEVFANLKTHWYSMHVGSEGAKHALDEFKAKYDLLLATGKDKEASDLLKGTLNSAKLSLAAMQSAGFVARGMGEVSKEGVQSQKALIDTLNAQLEVQEKLAAINSGEKGNAKTEEAQAEAGRQRALYDAQQKGLNQRWEAEKRYAKEVVELHKKAAKEDEEMAKAAYDLAVGDAERAAKVQQGLAAEALKDHTAMDKLRTASDDQEAKHRLAMREANLRQTTEAEVKAAQDSARRELATQDEAIAALNKNDAEYLVKLQQFEDKKAQIIQQKENQITKIREEAAEKQYQDIRKAEERMADSVSKNIAKSIVEGKNMAQAFAQMGKQMTESATENMIKMLLLDDMKQAKDAGHAAASAFKWVMADVPFPMNAAIAPVAAAAAFAGVMAFEHGGEIPGIGAQPIIGHGGETVVTKALTDRVKDSEGRGRGRQQPNVNITVVAKDADSFKASKSQIHGEMMHSMEVAQRRNG